MGKIHDDQKKSISRSNKNKLNQDNNIVSISNGDYSVEIIMANHIVPKEQPWFLPGIIPMDTSTLFAGFGGSGKTLLLTFIASKTSTGQAFMAGGLTHKMPQGGVIILAGEDDFEYQITPRLIASDADLSKIYLLKMMKSPGRPKSLIDLDLHLSLLEKTIQDSKELGNEIKLIIIDPVQYFTGELKDHIGSLVCRFVTSLNDLAKKYNLAIIMNKHLRKKGSGDGASSAVDSVSGSGAWTTAPRACWLIHRHPEKDGVVLFADLKTNLKAKDSKSMAYKIDGVKIQNPSFPDDPLNTIQTTSLTWLDEMEDFNADSALNTASESPAEASIREWIIKFLIDCGKNANNGFMFSSIELFKECMKSGFSKSTFYRIKKKMIDDGLIKEQLIGNIKKINMIILNDPELYN